MQGYDIDAVAADRRNRFTTELSPEMKMKKLFVVGLDFQIWTGSTVLRKEDFSLGENGQLPPDDLVENFGSKKLLDTKTLNVFRAIKTRARRLLEENGVRFMGGYAVPVDRQDAVLTELDECVQAFNAEKARFMANYQSYVDKWIAGHPELAAQLRADGKSLDTVDQRLYADYGTMRMQPLEGDEARFNHKVEALSSTLFGDVVQMANEYYRKAILGKDKCRSWAPLLAIRNKLEGLSFLDGGIRPVITMIDAVRRHLPKEGTQIEGSALIELAACVAILSREDAMQGVADGRVTIEKMTQQIEAVRPQPALLADSPEHAPASSAHRSWPAAETGSLFEDLPMPSADAASESDAADLADIRQFFEPDRSESAAAAAAEAADDAEMPGPMPDGEAEAGAANLFFEEEGGALTGDFRESRVMAAPHLSDLRDIAISQFL